MNLPNVITIARILLVPVTVWLIISGAFGLAFLAFIVAGISDGVDGAIARRYGLRTELGAYLDPFADKALLVSIYVSLGMLMFLPAWLVILVVTRDILIVSGVILSRLLDKPLLMAPMMISKVNTAAQIVFAGAVLGVLELGIDIEPFLTVGMVLVAGLTAASGALYLREWLRHMANGGRGAMEP